MKVKAIILFILILQLILLFTGCNSASVSNYVSDQKIPDFEEVNLKEKPPSDQEITHDENTAVINVPTVDVYKSPDIHSERVTQAILNQPVSILSSQADWTNVKVVDGYIGWIKTKNLDKDCSSIFNAKDNIKVLVTSKLKKIYSAPVNGKILEDIVMGTELYPITKMDGWYEVPLPGNKTGWVDNKDIIQIPLNNSIPKKTASDFIASADKFKSTSYLWGGISGFGIDCSGLTYICSKVNGVVLPRDSYQQFEIGKHITKNSIEPGDLLFFSKNEDLEGVSHVGIFIGKNQFIHANLTKGAVVIGDLNSDYYKKRLVGIRRIF